MKRLGMVVFAMLAITPPVHAQAPSNTSRADGALNRSLSLSVSHQTLSSGFANWNDQMLRLVYEVDRRNLLNAELVSGHRFGDRGVLGGLAWTRVLNEDWYSTVGYARTGAGVFWPIAQGYGTINRKWLENKALISSLSMGFDESRNGYSGRWASLSASFYAPNNFLLGAGVRLNQTNPGDVRTLRHFASVTWGTRGNAYLSLSYNGGREGYQLLNSSALTNFSSTEWIAHWKQWITQSAGLEFRLFDYRNSFYQRTGAEAGVFVEF